MPQAARRNGLLHDFRDALPVHLRLVKRPLWERKLRSAFRRRSVVWLMGVRRVGETVLARALSRFEYLDCELPRVRRKLDDPGRFLGSLDRRAAVVLDAMRRLQDPAALLRIAVDHQPPGRRARRGLQCGS